MKNKKNIYILLPIVLLIWGAVMYQFFTFSNNQVSEFEPQTEISLNPLNFKEQDSVPFDVNYRDPFLGKAFVSNENKSVIRTTKSNSNSKLKKLAKPIETIIWPTIIYKGIVSDTKEKNKVFMLIIDGKTFLMRAKNNENGVFLVEGDRESIELEYKRETKLILLEE